MLVFEGARGTGKTALLDRWTGLLDQVVPFARIDFEANRDVDQPRVLAALAFELSRRCADYLTLWFPRFITGRFVMRMDLDLEDHTAARRQVGAGLDQEQTPGALEQILVQAASGVLGFVQQNYAPGLPLREIADPAIKGAMPRISRALARRKHRLTLGAFRDWYGHRGRGFTNDATDVLVDLNRWARNADDEDNSQRINELLWDAFLTDLSEEYRHAKRVRDLTANCVILLDNVDTEGGRSFLDQLVRTRRARIAGSRPEPEPLTVIATSRGALLSDLPLADQIEYAGDGAHARHLIRSDGTVRHWWCRYPLSDLSADQVGSMVSGLNLPEGNNERLTRLAYQLTGGHPSSTRLLLAAVAERPAHRDELARLLDLPQAGHAAKRLALAAAIRARLLIGSLPVTYDGLVTCAGAVDSEDATRLAGDGSMFSGGGPNYLDDIHPMLWPDTSGAGPALLRRLLLRDLAARGGSGAPGWSTVFTWLRSRRAKSGDENGELYYALADGALGFVAGRLLARIGTDDAAAWLALLDTVTTAPFQQHYLPRGTTDDLVEPMTAVHEVTAVVPATAGVPVVLCRLVAGLQVVTDPLTDSRRRDVHLRIARDFEAVAELSTGATAPLLRRAREHRRAADLWL
ncbi:MAG TPA: hypothetical protein VH352_08035 [Pseudonocardiaceae bacterium]|nr:hypothetical protein [Pseudonocardiaceae bacterium]